MIQKAALHGIGENPAQTGVDSFDGTFGERLSSKLVWRFAKLRIELAEVLRAKLCQLVPAQVREEPVNVLLLPYHRGPGQLVGSDVPEPDVDVGFQRDALVHGLRGVLALPLEQDGLLVQPLLQLLRRQALRRADGFLPGLPPVAVVVVAHGHHDQVAAVSLSDTCHIS